MTPRYPSARHSRTLARTSLMNAFSSTRSCVHSVSSDRWAPRFLGRGIGTKYALTRRASTTSSVIPSSENRKCRDGSS